MPHVITWAYTSNQPTVLGGLKQVFKHLLQFKMDRWSNKVAVVTGASSGIGEAICRDLCARQVIVVGLARSKERLGQIEVDITASGGRFVPIVCDLTVEDQIGAAFERIVSELGGVDILVNNAGIFPNAGILEPGCDAVLTKTIETNLVGVISCTRKAYKSMSERDVDGYIINISSIAGHTVSANLPGLKPFPAAYFASKFGLTALTKGIAQELVFYKNSKIRISNISPGMVETPIFTVGGFEGPSKILPMLQSEDVTSALVYILSTPSHVQIRDIILEAVGVAFY